MTISTEVQKVTAGGNGSATSFSFSPVQVFSNTDLVVSVVDAAGNEVTLVEGTGAGNYAVVVSAYPGTGSITYPASGATRLQTGETIVMQRVLPLTQIVDLENQGGYFPDVLETGLDRIVGMIQQQQDELDRAVKSSTADGPMGLLPSKTLRANQNLSFDANGDPTVSAPTSATVSSAMQPIVNASTTDTAVDLLKVERVFVLISALRANTNANLAAVRVKDYATQGDMGGGLFVKIDSDLGSADDGGSIIVDAGGRRWYRDMSSRVLSLRHFGVFPEDGVSSPTDQSTQIQKWIDKVGSLPGVVGVADEGTYGIGSTINFGNGTTTSFSTTCNGSTFIWKGMGAAAGAMIDSSSVVKRTGVIFRWVGANGGTMAQILGPLTGMKWVGTPSFDGFARSPSATGALRCLQGFAFQNCDFDGIGAYNWKDGGVGILFTAHPVLTILGDAGAPAASHNTFGRLIAFSPYAANAYCINFDGHRVVSGSNFTVGVVMFMECGFSLANSKGLVLGYTDNITIVHLLNITYNSLSGSPAGIYLDGTAVPFNAPNQIRIIHATVGGSVGIGGATGGKNIIDEYTLDDGSNVPTGVTGMEVKWLSSHGFTALNGLPVEAEKTVFMAGDGNGVVGRDGSGAYVGSLTRQNSANLHLSAAGNIEFKAGATGASNALNYTMGATFFIPNDNVSSLGGASNRWSVVYSTTGAINTSDGNQKKLRGALTTPEMAAWARVQPTLFKFQDAVAMKGEDAARMHMGFVAQEVAAAFAAEGLDAGNYGLWCKDTVEGKDVLGLRYDECWAFEAAYQRDRAKRSEDRITALEAQLASVVSRLSVLEVKK